MQIVKIKSLENGSHQNQMGNLTSVPEGWAVIPDNMELENFPFGEVKVKEVDGVMTVIKWIAGTIPENKEAEPPVDPIDQMRADIDYIAIMTGVEL